MAKITLTTRTPKEISALFAAVCKDMKPAAAARPLTQEDRLAPYRTAVLKQRRRGLSWLRIAEAMADPRIGEHVSDKLLRRVFGPADPAKRTGRKPAVAADTLAESGPDAAPKAGAEATTEPRTERSADARTEPTAEAAAEGGGGPPTRALA